LDIVQKLWAPLRKLFAASGVPKLVTGMFRIQHYNEVDRALLGIECRRI